MKLRRGKAIRETFFYSLRNHWPEYLMEAVLLGLYMMSAGIFSVLLHTPRSPIGCWVYSRFLHELLYGVAMGVTSTALVYSPWGRRSGAHANSAITLAYWKLGKIKTFDALFYVAAQVAGGVSGVAAISLLLGDSFRLAPVRYVVTQPGPQGVWWALMAELAISFVLMSTILSTTNRPALARYTGLFTGFLTLLFITVEAPLSGMSMNPARTLSSAIPGWLWMGVWIYLVGPIAGMLLAVEVRKRVLRAPMRACAKLYHDNHVRCIFCGNNLNQPTGLPNVPA
jgi:aquaporin Z